jgi:hypothetical protein
MLWYLQEPENDWGVECSKLVRRKVLYLLRLVSQDNAVGRTKYSAEVLHRAAHKGKLMSL